MEVEIVAPPEYPGDMAMARYRGLVKHTIQSCTACELVCGMQELGVSPVPYSAPFTPSFCVVGEGPGSDESRVGRPFVGRSGKLLRAMLGAVGITGSDVLFANVVSCWPKASDGKATRAPTQKEAAACRGNLLAQTLLCRKPYVLLVGGTALSAVRPDLKVSKVHGRILLWNVEVEGEVFQSYYCMPILHPAAILRQRVLKDPTMDDLRRWADIVKGEIDPEVLLGVDKQGELTCVICGDYMSHFDPDGVGYCEKHWGRHGREWLAARDRGEGQNQTKVKVRGKYARVSDDQQTLG